MVHMPPPSHNLFCRASCEINSEILPQRGGAIVGREEVMSSDERESTVEEAFKVSRLASRSLLLLSAG